MKEKISAIFAKSRSIPSKSLSEIIWHKIIIRNKRLAILRVTALSFLGLLSLAGIVPAFINLTKNLSTSGIYEYTSLLFSKNSELALYWKELMLSIAESLPIIEIAYFFMLILFLFISIKFIAKQITKNQFALLA